MRPQGSNNKTRSVLASTNGSGAPARQSKDSSKKQTSAPKTTIFASDTPGNYQEGVKSSKYKTSVMYSSRLKSDAPSRQFQVNVAEKKSSTLDTNLFANDTPVSQLEGIALLQFDCCQYDDCLCVIMLRK
ncbi:hypothetical protein CTI12_AA472150 [Artemisia annua]|uniref:Uncharacterized protein n=1 Tax=Artemisia annua TaxID=35608 RepID=A0A2U1LNB8_ARTAN|nr:hypothetical protein CTI12_AA472150 [Artemisia annua]